MKGLLGRKIGMTQVYAENGVSIAVSVIEVEPNIVTSVFTKDKDGYNALQLGIVDVKKNIQKKPAIGHFKKAKTVPKKFVKEIRGMEGHELGSKIDVSIFKSGELVDITGTSKGKGFAGAIKRHNQSIGPKSHGGGGGSQPVRQTGSLGDISGNKVVKGMTMPGQMGNVQRTQQNLEVIKVDVENNLILIKGSIPGPKKSYVIIREAVKGLASKEERKLVDRSGEKPAAKPAPKPAAPKAEVKPEAPKPAAKPVPKPEAPKADAPKPAAKPAPKAEVKPEEAPKKEEAK